MMADFYLRETDAVNVEISYMILKKPNYPPASMMRRTGYFR
jgi:hypothetical protein